MHRHTSVQAYMVSANTFGSGWFSVMAGETSSRRETVDVRIPANTENAAEGRRGET